VALDEARGSACTRPYVQHLPSWLATNLKAHLGGRVAESAVDSRNSRGDDHLLYFQPFATGVSVLRIGPFPTRSSLII